jgi:hypothetical protein
MKSAYTHRRSRACRPSAERLDFRVTLSGVTTTVPGAAAAASLLPGQVAVPSGNPAQDLGFASDALAAGILPAVDPQGTAPVQSALIAGTDAAIGLIAPGVPNVLPPGAQILAQQPFALPPGLPVVPGPTTGTQPGPLGPLMILPLPDNANPGPLVANATSALS